MKHVHVYENLYAEVLQENMKMCEVLQANVLKHVHVYKNLYAEVLNENLNMCDILQANVLIAMFPPFWSKYRN